MRAYSMRSNNRFVRFDFILTAVDVRESRADRVATPAHISLTRLEFGTRTGSGAAQ